MDLQVFRQQAIGDRLRGVYDSLAKDPNSLANLDQVSRDYCQNDHPFPLRTYPIMLNMSFQYIPFPKNGFGVRLGALKNPRKRWSSDLLNFFIFHYLGQDH